MNGGQLVVTGEKQIGEHAVEVEVDKVRRMIEQERPVFEHDFERI